MHIANVLYEHFLIDVLIRHICGNLTLLVHFHSCAVQVTVRQLGLIGYRILPYGP